MTPREQLRAVLDRTLCAWCVRPPRCSTCDGSGRLLPTHPTPTMGCYVLPYEVGGVCIVCRCGVGRPCPECSPVAEEDA